LKNLATQMDATRKRFKVGDVTKTDVAQAESRFARAQADVSAARANLKTARANFVNITGLDTEPSQLPSSSITMPESLDIALRTAQDWNPSLRAAVHSKRAAGYTINSRLGAHLPEISARGSVSSTRDPSPLLDQQDNAQVGIYATIPLYEGGATTARVREARQTFNAREADVDAAYQNTINDVTRLWGEWYAAMDEIDAREAQVKAAAVAQFGTKKEADFGARSVLDTLDSNQELLDARLSLLTARRNEVVTRFSLLASMGMLSPKILGFGNKIPDFNREISRARLGF
jgi:outer membrane protein